MTPWVQLTREGREAAILELPCSWCPAKVGEPCRTVTGLFPGKGTDYHMDRVRGARDVVNNKSTCPSCRKPL